MTVHEDAIDELREARSALIDALGSVGAVPLGGLAAGIRKLAEQRDGGPPETCGNDPGPRRWDGPDWPVGSVGC